MYPYILSLMITVLTQKCYRKFVNFQFLQRDPLTSSQGISEIQVSISSALLRVVSVMLVPPMIRANSRFLPSRSRGVTVV